MKTAPKRSNKPRKPLFKGAAYKRAQNGYKFWFKEPLSPKVLILNTLNAFYSRMVKTRKPPFPTPLKNN
jgi:hypothetical protein